MAQLPAAANNEIYGISYGYSNRADGQIPLKKTGEAQLEIAEAIAIGDRVAANTAGKGIKALATLETALAGSDNDIVWTSQLKGKDGDRITIEYVDPGGASAALSVDVQGYGIKINLATGTDSAITSTADLIKAAVAANPAAAALVVGTDADGNDGSGVVIALVETKLSGGAGDFATCLRAGTTSGDYIIVDLDK